MHVYGQGASGLPKDGNEVTMDLQLLETPQNSLGPLVAALTERVDKTAASSLDPPESPTPSIFSSSKRTWSDLHEAARLGKDHAVQELLERGFDPNGQDEENVAPLQVAASKGHQSCIRILLDYGADINCSTDGEDSALEAASHYGHADIVRLLLEKGATDKDHALYLAARGGYETTVDMLIKARANSRFKHFVRGYCATLCCPEQKCEGTEAGAQGWRNRGHQLPRERG